MKQKVRFIVNPFSGTSNKTNIADVIASELSKTRFDYEIALTKHAGHAIALSKEAAEQNFDIVVAVGGDGSVNEVAQSLIHTNTALGVLPGGSGNGFSMHLGIGRDIRKAIRKLNQGTIKLIDTCKVNDRFFVNVAGLGFDAKIAFLTKLNKKRGFLPYFSTTLKEARKFKTIAIEIDADGDKIEGEFAAAVVANASMYGYYFTIAPTASLNDGLLDLMLIKKAPLYKYFINSPRFLNRSLHKSSIVQMVQAEHIKMRLAECDFLHVDGEGYQSDVELDFRIVKASLSIIC